MTDEDLPKEPAREDLSELDDIERKSDELRAKVFKAGHAPMPDVPDWDYERKKKYQPEDTGNYMSLGLALSIMYTLIGGMAMGLGIGWLIDMKTKSTIYTGLIGLVGAVFGLYGVFVIIRQNQQNQQKK